MNKESSSAVAERFFSFIVNRPAAFLLIGLVLIGIAASFVPQMTKDTSADSFMDPNDPALVYRDKVRETFGLKDPMVIAVVNQGEHGVFTPNTLSLVSWLSEEIAEVPGVDPEKITSIATEDAITGVADGMEVEPFYETPPTSQTEANKVRQAVMDFPLYVGSIVARDASATLVVMETLDDDEATRIYGDLLDLVARAPVNDSESLYVAGPGAVSGYLSSYIDQDAIRLYPMTGLIITLVVLLAYRSWHVALLCTYVMLGTVAIALGAMAGSATPFYVISNALPVVLIGIAVADSIHILGTYYEELASNPDIDRKEAIVNTMTKMWRPVTFTSLTTIAGFTGIYVSSYMPPMQAVGLFASIGVATALVYSIFILPAGLAVLKTPLSAAYRHHSNINDATDSFGKLMSGIGRFVTHRPIPVLGAAVVVVGLGIAGASQLKVDEAWINNFKPSEPIYIADNAINTALDGTYYLDVVIETPDDEAMLAPKHLQKIAELQAFLETLPHVNGTTSIVDYLKQMNKAMNENQPEAYALPDGSDLAAQYLLLYSASGSPSDLEDQIDYDYRLANVRAMLDSGFYSDSKVVIEQLALYLENNFNTDEIQATISGQVAVSNKWISQLAESHFRGLFFALLCVWIMAALSFRSAVAGILTVVPVALSVLFIYAVMGFSGIWLGVGTSMFAAIAIGVGVDFSIHTVNRLIELIKKQRIPMDRAFELLYPSTGRALLFNFAAVFFGFGVLATSQVPPLVKFGTLVAVAVTASFIASMMLIPPLVKLLKPRFLGLHQQLPSSSALGEAKI